VGSLLEQIREHSLIALWGMPGVGKSGLVEAIYSRPQTRDKFLLRAWASVSHPSILTENRKHNLPSFQKIMLIIDNNSH
jgi:replication-associated recombination protein RarA